MRPRTLETMGALAEGFRAALPGRALSLVVNKFDLLQPGDDIILPDALLKPGLPIHRTSARTGNNVRAAFEDTADAINRRRL
jgi:hypothetical protein